MEINFCRSSSLNQWNSYCEQSYFINYVLGHQQVANKKADMGTAAHKVLEILSVIKQQFDINPTEVIEINDDSLGVLRYNTADMRKKKVFNDIEVSNINKTRINKQVYTYNTYIPNNHVRWGVGIIEEIIDRSSKHYSAKSAEQWGRIDFKHVNNYSCIPLELFNGNYDPRKRKIVNPESHFQIPIEQPWAKLSNGEYFTIKGTIDLVTQVDDNLYEIIDWKGLPIHTPIPTKNGWSTMGDLKIGDFVFDRFGQTCKVTGKSQIKTKNCFRVIFDDKTSVVCDDEHLWKLHNNTTVSISELKIGDQISVAKPINCEHAVLPIDPYVLGVWLGDGRNRCGEISSADESIFTEIIKRGYTVGKNTNKNRCPSRTIYGLTSELKKLNLIHNKHIPDIYLRASYSQRLSLLQGLMDSDGNVNIVRKQCIFTNCNKTLSDNVKELLYTLGQRPNQSNITRNTNFSDNVQVFPISFRPIDINPFLLDRKASQINDWGLGKSNVRRVISIVKSIMQKTQCISVDSPDHTYLCTKNYIPTHNTGARKDWGKNKVKEYKDLSEDIQLMLYYYAAKQLYPDKDVIITIFFIRDGGPYTLTFDDRHVRMIERILSEHKWNIDHCESPKLLDTKREDFRCKKLCHYCKNNWPGTEQSQCQFIQEQIQIIGIDEVINKYTKPGFKLGHYEAPGE